MASEKYAYTIVPGFFVYDTEGTDALSNVLDRGEQIPEDFGLLDTSSDRWQRFKDKVACLREKATDGTQYKVIFIGRHGEGYHNLAMATKPYCDVGGTLSPQGKMTLTSFWYLELAKSLGTT
ncbi:hypothetical protein FRC02_005874 [Tulasnella sp. 418]|nr:hypothetical protein FRC02_005874 [Tulasnella sp. 418]